MTAAAEEAEGCPLKAAAVVVTTMDPAAGLLEAVVADLCLVCAMAAAAVVEVAGEAAVRLPLLAVPLWAAALVELLLQVGMEVDLATSLLVAEAVAAALPGTEVPDSKGTQRHCFRAKVDIEHNCMLSF